MVNQLNSENLQQIEYKNNKNYTNNIFQIEDQNMNSSNPQSKSLQVQNNENENEKQKQILTIKKNRISKKQTHKQMKLLENKRKQTQQYLLELIHSRQIQKNFITPKSFLLIGGIFIQLENEQQIDYDDDPAVINVTNIIKSFKDGSVQINLGAQEINSNIDYAVWILQSSQSQINYDLSLSVVKAKKSILSLKDQIEFLTSYYESNKLNSIIQLRNQYVSAISLKAFNFFIKEGDFGQIAPWSIDWKSKSMINSSCLISQSMIALVGTDGEGFINYIMRKNQVWMLNPENRRKIVQSCLLYLIDQDTNKSKEFIIEDFEIKTIDNIIIRCQCKIFFVGIEYPKELQFYGPNIEQLNSSDSIIITKLIITKEHLEYILKIRQNRVLQMQKQQCEEDNQNQLIAENFDYYMNSSVFLEKFYSKYKEINEDKDTSHNLKTRCSYRLIDLELN